MGVSDFLGIIAKTDEILIEVLRSSNLKVDKNRLERHQTVLNFVEITVDYKVTEHLVLRVGENVRVVNYLIQFTHPKV